MDHLGIGVIGSGFMGKCHALAYNAVRPVFGDLPVIKLHTICDTPLEKAEAARDQFGFVKATDRWLDTISDPAIDIISITTPNKLHFEMAIAALEAGKHVHCEKPMALTMQEAQAMVDAARARDAKTIVGYNYIANPAYRHAQRLIADGAIGR